MFEVSCSNSDYTELSEHLQEFLNGAVEDEEFCNRTFVGYVRTDGSVVFMYDSCNYSDLNQISSAARDEAILRMIAENADRLERFVAESTISDSE